MASQSNEPLPDGYRLNSYTIEKLLSSGGFSIVYLGRDESGAPVAIKEYLPAALVIRVGGAEVKINSDENLAVFRHGLKCFFEEGRSLARSARQQTSSPRYQAGQHLHHHGRRTGVA